MVGRWVASKSKRT